MTSSPEGAAGAGRTRVRRHAAWVAGAVLAAGSLVLAVVAPASWWGVAFAAGVLGGLGAARRVVPEAYRPAWPRTMALLTGGAALAGGCYAFAVAPFGPRPALAWSLGLVLLVLVFAPVASMTATGWVGPLGRHGDDLRRARRSERR